MERRKQERLRLQYELNDCQDKLYALEHKTGSVIVTSKCEEEQNLIGGLRSKISDLTNKLK